MLKIVQKSRATSLLRQVARRTDIASFHHTTAFGICFQARGFSGKPGADFASMLNNLSGDKEKEKAQQVRTTDEELYSSSDKKIGYTLPPFISETLQLKAQAQAKEESAAAAVGEAPSVETHAAPIDEGSDSPKEDKGKNDAGEEGEDKGKMGEEKEEDNGPSAVEQLQQQLSGFDARSFAQSLPARSRLASETFVEEVRLAWDELFHPEKASVLERRVHQADSYVPRRVKSDDEDSDDEDSDDEGEEAKPQERGPSAMVLVHEPTSQWEAMRARLADSPVIREIFKRSKVVYKTAAATDAGAAAADAAENLKDKVEDAREFWETSQNPLVYTMSGVWDNVTGETEEGLVTAELLKLDPDFNKEEFLAELKDSLVPETINAHLSGQSKFLKRHCGEACYSKLHNDIKQRKEDKVEFESKMIDLDESQVVMKFLESGSPVLVCMYMVQQINVVKKDGEVIDGDDSQVVARFYSMAFQQEYDEDDGVVRWRIVDYEYGGDMPYY